MTLEEVKEKLKVFDKYTFEEDTHTYYCNGKKVGIGVTSLIGLYANKFDEQSVAEMVAQKQNKEVIEILDEWHYKRDFSCEKGTTIHEYTQSLFSKNEWQIRPFDNSKKYLEVVDKIKQHSINYYNDYKDRYIHIKDELLIGVEWANVSSAIDHLFYDIVDKGVIIVDYKTNSYMDGYFNNPNKKVYKKYMMIPFEDTLDNSYEHYKIQLSIYKYILQELIGIPVLKTEIVYLTENKDNYEVIQIPYKKEKAKLMLEMRRERKMGKCIPVLIIGHSGSGKSASLRNLTKEDYSLVNPLAKRLPFKGGQAGLESCDYELIKKFIQETPKNIIVIDDSNYLLTMEMMKKAKETGYGKFTDIALNYWKLIDFIKNLDGDKRVYLMSHEEVDENGFVGVKTVGKMLSNQCCVEGLYTIVLRATTENGKYQFQTASLGNDIVKAPMGMFDASLIDNDLKLVDNTICEYYEINKEEEKKAEEEK